MTETPRPSVRATLVGHRPGWRRARSAKRWRRVAADRFASVEFALAPSSVRRDRATQRGRVASRPRAIERPRSTAASRPERRRSHASRRRCSASSSDRRCPLRVVPWPPAGGRRVRGADVAVLPFENLGDSADDYFADGITDEVRGKLAVSSRARRSPRGPARTQYPEAAAKAPQQIAPRTGRRVPATATVRWEKRRRAAPGESG